MGARSAGGGLLFAGEGRVPVAGGRRRRRHGRLQERGPGTGGGAAASHDCTGPRLRPPRPSRSPRGVSPARLREPQTIRSLMWLQREIRLAARVRGFQLVTAEVLEALPELQQISVGLLHLLIQHTSASLALSENASPEVRADLDAWLDRAVPEGAPYWTHTLEGDDDMPAHVT